MKIYSSEIIKRMRVEGCRTCPNREVERLGHPNPVLKNICIGMPMKGPDGVPIEGTGVVIDDEVREGGSATHRLCPLPDEETTIKERS